MKFPKEIIDEFVSWIDLKDVKEYIKQLKKKPIKYHVFSYLTTKIKSSKVKKYDTYIFLKGGEFLNK